MKGSGRRDPLPAHEASPAGRRPPDHRGFSSDGRTKGTLPLVVPPFSIFTHKLELLRWFNIHFNAPNAQFS